MPFLSTLESVICRQLAASPAEKPHRAAAGAKTGQVTFLPVPENGLCRGLQGSFRGGHRAVVRCRTVRQHTVDGVTIRYPLAARGSRFTTPPPGGTSCFTTHRRRSGRRARPNFGRALPGSRPKFGQRYRCDNLSQPLPAGAIPSASSLPPGPRCGRRPERGRSFLRRVEFTC